MTSSHHICITLQLVLLSNMGVTTPATRSLTEINPTWAGGHSAHHVPVELLFCEPEGQGTAPAAGHRGDAVWINRTWGEAHQSTAAGLHSSLHTYRGKESSFNIASNEVCWNGKVTHRYCLGILVSEEQLSSIKVIIQVEEGTVRGNSHYSLSSLGPNPPTQSQGDLSQSMTCPNNLRVMSQYDYVSLVYYVNR